MSKEGDNSFGVASVILGILSIVSALGLFMLFVYGPVAAIILSIIGLVFASKQKKIKNNEWARIGKILNIIGLVAGIILFAWLIKVVKEALEQLSILQQQGAFGPIQ